MAHIFVDKSKDNAKPHSFVKFIPSIYADQASSAYFFFPKDKIRFLLLIHNAAEIETFMKT